MSELKSIASRRNWEKVPKEERSRMMSDKAKILHKGRTKEERHMYAMKMVKAKRRKNKNA